MAMNPTIDKLQYPQSPQVNSTQPHLTLSHLTPPHTLPVSVEIRSTLRDKKPCCTAIQVADKAWQQQQHVEHPPTSTLPQYPPTPTTFGPLLLLSLSLPHPGE